MLGEGCRRHSVTNTYHLTFTASLWQMTDKHSEINCEKCTFWVLDVFCKTIRAHIDPKTLPSVQFTWISSWGEVPGCRIKGSCNRLLQGKVITFLQKGAHYQRGFPHCPGNLSWTSQRDGGLLDTHAVCPILGWLWAGRVTQVWSQLVQVAPPWRVIFWVQDLVQAIPSWIEYF